MKIVCATNMPFAEEAFSTLGSVKVLPPQAITASAVRDADLLAIRSTTRVTRELLQGSRVRFVGTATIGYDHLDLSWLRQAGIAWCAAPGCNANSVAEYLVAALLCLARRHNLSLAGKTIGVVGVGNVGRRVVQKAAALGMKVLLNDPPRQDAEQSSDFLPLSDLLAASDIISLHVPMTKNGPYPTSGLADELFFARLKPGAIFINAARGGVVNSDALLQAMRAGIVAHAVLDTWEHEPAFRVDVQERIDLGTPHIAGHSFDGKVMGTVMVYHAACRFLGREPEWSPDAFLPPPPVPVVNVQEAQATEEMTLDKIVKQVYDIEADDQALRANSSPEPALRAAAFERLRQEYPVRREFRFTQVKLAPRLASLQNRLRQLGFAVNIAENTPC